MQYTNSFGTFLVGLLAASELAAAVPASFRQSSPVSSSPRGLGSSGRGASVKQVRNAQNDGKARVGALAVEKVYMKFGVELPEDLSSAVARIRENLAAGLDAMGFELGKRASGSAVTTPEKYDVEYLTPVQIGTPAQTLNLNLDTGSSDLWVYSSETPSDEVKGQAVYNTTASSTSVKQDKLSWSISYGDGSSSKGDVYYDTVSIAGVAVTNMSVETATKVSSEFTADSNMDGLLGLGFKSINMVSPTKQDTFFDKAQGDLDSFVFTADLKAGEPGTYNFGYIDNASYTGEIYYSPVDDADGYWKFSLTGYGIGNGTFNATTIKGIADTGTTLMMMPDAVVHAYYAEVSGAAYDSSQGGYTFPCDVTPPDFTLGVGPSADGTANGTIVIPGAYLNYTPLDGTNVTCYGGIQSQGSLGFAIFGDVALKAAFVVFEGGDSPQIGWAAKDL